MQIQRYSLVVNIIDDANAAAFAAAIANPP
jgi:hypothetical protein